MTREALLFVHSTGTGPSLWDGVPSPRADLEELRPALIGYPPRPRLSRGEAFAVADDVAVLVTAVPPHLDRVHVVAHSYGGLLALLAARQLGARVGSLLLAEPVLFGALAREVRAGSVDVDPAAAAEARGFLEDGGFLEDEALGGSEAWLERFVDYWNRPGSWGRMPEAQRAETVALGWKMFQEVRACFADLGSYEDLRVAAPCTVVFGERTTAAARAMARAFARTQGDAHLVELPGVDHMAPRKRPLSLREALADHLARVRR